MHRVTDADRDAARALREVLADLSGYWYHGTDEGPLCRALARHRVQAEQRLLEKLTPFINQPDGALRPAVPAAVPLDRREAAAKDLDRSIDVGLGLT